MYIKEVFGFAEQQKNATCGLGYKTTLERKADDNAVDRAASTTNAEIFIGGFN